MTGEGVKISAQSVSANINLQVQNRPHSENFLLNGNFCAQAARFLRTRISVNAILQIQLEHSTSFWRGEKEAKTAPKRPKMAFKWPS
jgi:hypothetical protein